VTNYYHNFNLFFSILASCAISSLVLVLIKQINPAQKR
jgi:hypothetical protein